MADPRDPNAESNNTLEGRLRNRANLASLLELIPKNVNQPDEKGITPLMYAVMYRDEKLVNELLSRGADPYLPSKTSNNENRTPLEFATAIAKNSNEKYANLMNLMQDYEAAKDLQLQNQTDYVKNIAKEITGSNNKHTQAVVSQFTQSDDKKSDYISTLAQARKKILDELPKSVLGSTSRNILDDFKKFDELAIKLMASITQNPTKDPKEQEKLKNLEILIKAAYISIATNPSNAENINTQTNNFKKDAEAIIKPAAPKQESQSDVTSQASKNAAETKQRKSFLNYSGNLFKKIREKASAVIGKHTLEKDISISVEDKKTKETPGENKKFTFRK